MLINYDRTLTDLNDGEVSTFIDERLHKCSIGDYIKKGGVYPKLIQVLERNIGARNENECASKIIRALAYGTSILMHLKSGDDLDFVSKEVNYRIRKIETRSLYFGVAYVLLSTHTLQIPTDYIFNKDKLKQLTISYNTQWLRIFDKAINNYLKSIPDKVDVWESSVAHDDSSISTSKEDDFAIMCDIAMHDNLLKAYNGYVTWYAKEFGEREPILNKQGCDEHWEMLMKEASHVLFGEEYEKLNEHFAEFFTEDGNFRCAHIVKMIIKYNVGEKGWMYWTTLAKWKVAETVYKKGFGWIDGIPARMCLADFGKKEVEDLSSMSKNIYTIEQIQESAAHLQKVIVNPVFDSQYCSLIKPLLSDSTFQRLIDEGCRAKAGYELKIVPVTDTHDLDRMASNDLFVNAEWAAVKEELTQTKNEAESWKRKYEETFAERDKLLEELKLYREENRNNTQAADHDQLVSDIFTEIALRYMESTKEKTVEQRTKVKEALRDISFELKMSLTKDTQKCINKFDNANPPLIPQVNIHNEYVMEKNVTTEIGKVESGATGAIIKQSKPKNR